MCTLTHVLLHASITHESLHVHSYTCAVSCVLLHVHHYMCALTCEPLHMYPSMYTNTRALLHVHPHTRAATCARSSSVQMCYMCTLTCVLHLYSYMYTVTCALICARLHVCHYMCTLTLCVLHVHSYMCTLACALLHGSHTEAQCYNSGLNHRLNTLLEINFK